MKLPDSSPFTNQPPETRSAPEAATPKPLGAPAQAPEPQLAIRRQLSLCTIICSLMMGVSMVMVSWNLQDASLSNAYTGSHYATIESLVDYGTYYIDRSRYVGTIDKYKVGDHYISSKQPALSTYGAGIYWVYQGLTGKKISQHEGDVVRTVGLFTGGLFHVVFLVFFYRLCRLLLKGDLAVMLGMAAASFAFLGVAYATHINKHSPAAALTVCGLFYAARIGAAHAGASHSALASSARTSDFCLAGLALGLLVALDVPSVAFSGLVLLYLASYDWRRTLMWFVPALLPGLLCQLILTYEISGSFKPFQLNQAIKQFKGFYFKAPGGIDALREPKWKYAFNVLLGHHGLFSMTPLFLFGLWELVRCLWLRIRLRESLLVFATVFTLLGFYIFRTRNYGGWSVGMRWLVPSMPLLLLYFAFWVDRVCLTLGRWCVVLAAFLVSTFHVQDALTSPFQFSVWQNWLDGTPNRARVGKVFNLPRQWAKEQLAREKPPSAATPTPTD